MRKKLEKLSSTLGSLLQARGLTARLSEYRILGQWEKTVGKLIASHARPVSVRGAKLFLSVDSPAWMQQLSLLRPELLEKVNRGLGKKDAIKEIALNLGEVTGTGRPDAPPLLHRELSAEEEGKIDGFLAGVRDQDVKQAIRRVIEKDLQRKKTAP